MNTVARIGAVVVLLAHLAGCRNVMGPTAPSGPNVAPAVPVPSPPSPGQVSFPPLSGPSRTFVFDRQVSYPVSHSQGSRFVLYDSGAFALEYPTFTYRGAYRDTNGTIEFLFQFGGRGAAEPWDDATGTLNGDSLTVLYEETMQQNDFENAVYVLMR